MENLKFRAFDKNKNQMFVVTRIDFDSQEIDFDGNLNEPYHWDNFHITQFTGLKDKREMLIFEGDIVRFNWDESVYVGEIGKMSYSDCKIKCAHKIVEHTTGGESGIEKINFAPETSCINYLLRSYRNLTVLGNIYENPELLS